MSALATVRAAPGLDAYLDVLELRLERAVGSHPGLVGRIGAETLAAGGKRLRPVLVFLSAPLEDRGGEGPLAAGAAVELVHMATLVHDDLLDAAALRRGRPTVWAAARPVRRGRDRRLPLRPRVLRAGRRPATRRPSRCSRALRLPSRGARRSSGGR